MAPDTPRKPVFLDKGRSRIKRIAALRAEEMAWVPASAARDDDFALDRGGAGFAAGREAFVEVEVAIEARGFILAVLEGELGDLLGGFPAGQRGMSTPAKRARMRSQRAACLAAGSG